MITFDSRGSFKNLESFLGKASKNHVFKTLDKFAREGVSVLASATPVDSGVTAESWNYTIKKTRNSYSIIWTNNHIVDGRPIVIMLQYGHGTGTGGYVQGRDFINPAIRPIFDKIAENVWKAVTSV